MIIRIRTNIEQSQEHYTRKYTSFGSVDRYGRPTQKPISSHFSLRLSAGPDFEDGATEPVVAEELRSSNIELTIYPTRTMLAANTAVIAAYVPLPGDAQDKSETREIALSMDIVPFHRYFCDKK